MHYRIRADIGICYVRKASENEEYITDSGSISPDACLTVCEQMRTGELPGNTQ